MHELPKTQHVLTLRLMFDDGQPEALPKLQLLLAITRPAGIVFSEFQVSHGECLVDGLLVPPHHAVQHHSRTVLTALLAVTKRKRTVERQTRHTLLCSEQSDECRLVLVALVLGIEHHQRVEDPPDVLPLPLTTAAHRLPLPPGVLVAAVVVLATIGRWQRQTQTGQDGLVVLAAVLLCCPPLQPLRGVIHVQEVLQQPDSLESVHSAAGPAPQQHRDQRRGVERLEGGLHAEVDELGGLVVEQQGGEAVQLSVPEGARFEGGEPLEEGSVLPEVDVVQQEGLEVLALLGVEQQLRRTALGVEQVVHRRLHFIDVSEVSEQVAQLIPHSAALLLQRLQLLGRGGRQREGRRGAALSPSPSPIVCEGAPESVGVGVEDVELVHVDLHHPHKQHHLLGGRLRG
mmetsp:Transcript_30694/g.89298  ORF Transcript_30694/g.89298 Transcript_30694/m.89298 type:complete len:401 (+) Transcript_30694:3125-4327(+)